MALRRGLAELLQNIRQVRININPSFSIVTDMMVKLFRDKSGSINYTELQAALTTFGYNLSPPVYTLLIR